MTLSARRLLALVALAALGGAAAAQAVAAPRGAKAPAAATKQKQRPKAKAKARAVKLSGGVAWAPTSALAPERTPLTGAPGTGGGAATGGTGTSGSAGNGASGGATGTGGGTTPGTGTTPDPPPQQQALGVTVDERNAYTMVLSRTTLTAGSTTIQLNNLGEDPHNLRIVRTSPSGGATTDFPDTVKGSPTAKALTLTSGTYYLYCTLTTPVSHEAAGMHATLRVDP